MKEIAKYDSKRINMARVNIVRVNNVKKVIFACIIVVTSLLFHIYVGSDGEKYG